MPDQQQEKQPGIQNPLARKIIFITVLLVCATPIMTPPLALFAGLIIANITGHPFLHLNTRLTRVLLQVSVIGLGFGMDIHTALSTSKEGFLFTVISLLSTLLLGTLLGKWLKIDKKTSHLISSGTAICGGSAIAAIAPVIEAEEKQISVALGIVFILNSVALFIFPVIGHWLALTQKQFGLWSAIAIHDTSSVVGAASRYGNEALQTATIVKLARTLWIIPLAIASAALFKTHSKKIKIPYFIGGFILAMILNTYVAHIQIASSYIVSVSKTGLTLTLFLIGAGLNKDVLKTVGIKPFIQGVLIWLFISLLALYAVFELA
jgi:uncharacterized integral membrane protein (TIGR00698 family)